MLNEIKDSKLKKEFEKKVKNPCPYITRVYEFISIMGNDERKMAVQCLYKGTIHEPKKCLENPEACKKFQILKKGEKFFEKGR